MTRQLLRERTYAFAVRAKRFCRPLLLDVVYGNAAKQLARSSAGMAGNYRSCGPSRSPKEFASRMAVVLEEADESVHWSSYLRDGGLTGPELAWICDEAQQFARIFNASLHTARKRAEEEEKRKRRRQDDASDPS